MTNASAKRFYDVLDELIADNDDLFVPVVRQAANPADDKARLFLEIVAFRERHGRAPLASARTPEEMQLGVRLDAFRRDPAKATALANLDQYGLLAARSPLADVIPASLDDLIASGDDLLSTPDDHIFEFRETPMPSSKAEADTIAERVMCREFDRFAPIFDQTIADVASGMRATVPTNSTYQIAAGDMFIIDGQLAYIADVGDWHVKGDGKKDARLRIIYDNGTESDHLLRSFGKALYRSENSRRVQSIEAGPLFQGSQLAVTGCIYVARTLSTDPGMADLRQHVLKIGSTTGKAIDRLAGAAHDATFLRAPAELIDQFETRGVHPRKIEALLHRFFAAACINVRIPDQFGGSVDPREWFFASPASVEQAVRLIATSSLHLYVYDLDHDRVTERDGMIAAK